MQNIYNLIISNDNEVEFLTGMIGEYGLPDWTMSKIVFSDVATDHFISIPWVKENKLSGVWQFMQKNGAYSMRMSPTYDTYDFPSEDQLAQGEQLIPMFADILHYQYRIEGETNHAIANWFEQLGLSEPAGDGNETRTCSFVYTYLVCLPQFYALKISDFLVKQPN